MPPVVVVVRTWAARQLGHWRRARPPRLLQEALLVAAGYWLYNQAQAAAPLHAAAARMRGLGLYHAEQVVYLDVERPLNDALVAVPWLTQVADYYYALMHLAVTSIVLLWMYRRRPLRYRPARSVLYATSLIALVAFWIWPVAPPRLLPQLHLVDTALVNHTLFSYSSGTVQSAANQFASMPSLHVAWALWDGFILVRFARPVLARSFGVLHPLLISLVVLATANHYLLDLVGGLAVLLLGALVARLLHGPLTLPQPTDQLAAAGSATAGGTGPPGKDGILSGQR